MSAKRKFCGAAKNIPKRDTLLLPFQAKWVKDDSRLKLMEKSRQIGISWASSYRIVSTTSLQDARYDDWVSSRDELQAKLFIDDCKSFASLLNIAAQDLGQVVVDEEKNNAFVLAYANGRLTNSLSSNPNAQAGKRGRRVLDEFALHPDPRKLYATAYPGITWGGNLEIISTHRGTANFFNTLIQEIKTRGNPKGFSLHTITLQTALDQGFLYKLQMKLPSDDPRQAMDEAAYFDFIKAGCADEESFLQEYCCIPGDDAAAFISYDMLDACGADCLKPFDYLLDCKNPLYVGVDVARKTDLLVIDVGEKIGDVVWDRLRLELQNKRFAEAEFELYRILELPQVKRACIDSTGLGMQFAERAKERFGYKVEAVSFTGPVKEELAFPLRAAFEDRRLRIDRDPKLWADLRGVKKEVTAAGNLRFVGETADSHCDRFWAKALRQHAAASKVNIFAAAA